jgi:septum formation protein
MKDLLKINKKIVLASKSPRRKKLLEQIGLSFGVITSDIDEKELDTSIEPAEYAKQLAIMKAKDVAGKLNDEAIVIGADTIVVLDGKILNKPEDAADARRMLGLLSGNTHTVYTGVALIDSKSKATNAAVKATDVTFRRLNEKEIAAYVATKSPLDKAGAYGIQDDFGAVFISHIEGCYYNIVGLPLEMLYTMLAEFSAPM